MSKKLKTIKEEVVSRNSDKKLCIEFVEDYIDGDDFEDIFSDEDVEKLYDKFHGNIFTFLLHKCKTLSVRETVFTRLEDIYDKDVASNFEKIFNEFYEKGFVIINEMEGCVFVKYAIYIEDESSIWIFYTPSTYVNNKYLSNFEIEDEINKVGNFIVPLLENIGEIYESDILDNESFLNLAKELKQEKEEQFENEYEDQENDDEYDNNDEYDYDTNEEDE